MQSRGAGHGEALAIRRKSCGGHETKLGIDQTGPALLLGVPQVQRAVQGDPFAVWRRCHKGKLLVIAVDDGDGARLGVPNVQLARMGDDPFAIEKYRMAQVLRRQA